MAASFALATYEDENRSDQEASMGIERFQALMQAYAMHLSVKDKSEVLDSRSKVSASLAATCWVAQA